MTYSWPQRPVFARIPSHLLRGGVQAVGGVYGGLQVLSERSAMVTRALDYIGDILKHIKPSLVSRNQEGLQLVYWAVGRCTVEHSVVVDFYILCLNLVVGLFDSGCIVKHWSPLLATSKAQQLLFRIVDGLLLPHNLTQQDKALRESLPLYLQVRTDRYIYISPFCPFFVEMFPHTGSF